MNSSTAVEGFRRRPSNVRSLHWLNSFVYPNTLAALDPQISSIDKEEKANPCLELLLLCYTELREAVLTGKTESRLAKMGFGDEASKVIASLRCALVEVEAATQANDTNKSLEKLY
ncbi:uncharacterized protein LOC114274184 isoform X1 [Camellia sinensis]|uniref:uncharacterized protein LOC114274184 isoform X1 n=1 Tax=Camellia sinensis TaxID=4442 RepID=UPI001036E512|nr:uncharacterized protein LOC114274184 isoform X1 [Camellia sinensis]